MRVGGVGMEVFLLSGDPPPELQVAGRAGEAVDARQPLYGARTETPTNSAA